MIDRARVAAAAGQRRDFDQLADHLASFGCFLFGKRAERLGGGTEDAERRRHMDVDHRLKLLIRLLLDHAIARVAGVVDDAVQPRSEERRGGKECVRMWSSRWWP